MTDYKDALDSFADRLKSNNQETPIQEVRPIEKALRKPKKAEKIVRTTIHLNVALHQKVKMHCVKTNISFKDFVTEMIEREMKT